MDRMWRSVLNHSKWKYWTDRYYKRRINQEGVSNLVQQIRAAHLEWFCAQQRLSHVVSSDEIDYAIFALETAEKRYSMMLKEARRAHDVGIRVVAFPSRNEGS
jgi:hypothetical protein